MKADRDLLRLLLAAHDAGGPHRAGIAHAIGIVVQRGGATETGAAAVALARQLAAGTAARKRR